MLFKNSNYRPILVAAAKFPFGVLRRDFDLRVCEMRKEFASARWHVREKLKKSVRVKRTMRAKVPG